MGIPVDVNQLIRGERIEGSRIEYKKGWNPQRILQTICAFANDIDNWGSSYIIVGVDAESEVPKVVGLDRSRIDSMEKELLSMSNLIEPRYLPTVDIEDVDGLAVMVIWVTTGDRRPYSCPVKYGEGLKRSDIERAYYIRKMSSTIRADQDDILRLHEISRRIPFDLCANQDATFDDVYPSLIRNYLYRVNSRLQSNVYKVPIEELCREMQITAGYREMQSLMNVALMFFNDRPDRFFRGAYIDIVHKPDSTGKGMTQTRITGPLDRQVIDALETIKNQFIRERIYKSDDSPEARRFFNYPFVAVRELLVNAVYHKSYEIGEPVRVTVTPTSIEFLNYPGPSTQLSDEDIENNNLKVGVYRNSRVGEFFMQLDLAESRFTGIPQVVEALERNGSPTLRILTDPGRTYFRAILPIHRDFLTEGMENLDMSMDEAILNLLESRGRMSILDISTALGYKGINRTVRSYISDLMDQGKVEFLYPDKPRSPKQRICLSDGARLH